MPSSDRTSPRDPWFDNAKFALVALVVLGHSLTLLPTNVMDAWVYDFLYAWHVPAFVLVTGYLSRSFSFAPHRIWSLVRTVVVPYLLFEAALAAFRTHVGGEHLENIWLNPHWPMWYLSSLVVWRLLTPAFQRMPLVVAFAVAVAVSLLAGLRAGDTLDLARALGLLPFFVLGLRMRKEHVELLQRRSVQYAGLVTLAVILLAARFTDQWISTEWLYYRSTYTALDVTDGAGMLTRLSVITVGLLGALGFLSLVPATRTWFTKLGAASLVVYLFHGFVVKGAEYAGVPAWSTAHPATSLLLVPSVALLLAAVLAAPPVARRLGSVVDPVGWLTARLARPPVPDQRPAFVAGPRRESVPMSAVGR